MDASRTQDVDFAHAGENISLALTAAARAQQGLAQLCRRFFAEGFDARLKLP